MQNVCVFVQWGMLIEQLSTVDPKKPIQALFLDTHQRRLPIGKRRAGGTELPMQQHQHTSAILTLKIGVGIGVLL